MDAALKNAWFLKIGILALYQEIMIVSKIMSMIRKYDNHKPQTIPWHREEEPSSIKETPGRQIKQTNQLSLPH